MAKFVNLTPHAINLIDRVIEPSGTVARCTEVSIFCGVVDGVKLVTRQYGTVAGVPDEQPFTMYIVSAMVRMALPDRLDIASPGDMVRDINGNITGCKNLVVNFGGAK